MNALEMAKLYEEDGWSLRKIGEAVGLSPKTVSARLEAVMVERRSRAEGKRMYHAKEEQPVHRLPGLPKHCTCSRPIWVRCYSGYRHDLKCGRPEVSPSGRMARSA